PSYTNSVVVKITKATNEWKVEPHVDDRTVGDPNGVNFGEARFGDVAAKFWSGDGKIKYSDIANVSTGLCMAIFTVVETANWTGLSHTNIFEATLGDKRNITVAATPYSGEYDGAGHTIAISDVKAADGLPLAETNIAYSLSQDGPFDFEAAPLFTNVCETSVWYRISAEGCIPFTGSAEVKITQAENSWTVEPSFSGNWLQDGTNCLKGVAKFGMATIEYFNSVDMPVSPDAITGAGSYTARFTVAETENWTGLTKDVSFNVHGMSAKVAGYEGPYDGSGHGVAVSVSNPESGWIIGYALSPDAEYKAECPLFTNVCETSVWYRVSAEGYEPLTGSASVKIACATNTWKVAPSMASWRDTEDASEPESASAFGEVIVAYKTANGRVLPSRPSVRGDYVAVFTVEGSENWTSVSTEVPFTIYESEPVVCVMATSCMGEYDGSSHSIEVSVDPGATNRCSARYSLAKDGPFADAAPVYVQAMTNGPVKVWYEVLADGYAGVTNFATVEIFKATNAWLVVPNMAGRTAGVEYEPPAAVSQFGNVSVVYDAAATNAPRNAGIHTARFTVPETRNWCGLVTNISYRIAGDGSSGEEDDGGDSGGDDDGGGEGEGEGGGSGGGDGEESDAYAIAFTNDATYAKAQTIAGALYNADGSLAGVVQLKFGKKNARKSTVRVSGSATLLDGRKASARGVTLKFGEDGAVSGTLTFKEPVGEMALVAGADGVGLLAGASYFMKAAKVGGPLAGGAASGVFRLSDDFDLAAAGTLQTALLPFEEPFSVVRRKWKFPGNASVKLQTDKATGLKSLTVSYGRNGDKTNKSSIKLSYTEKTGRFTGSFKAYSVSENARGSKKLVKYTVKIVGFVLDGSGVGAATVKKPAGGPWAVSVE
ncbi:MAG: hypothetical protein IIT98_07160, partial [Kiritimatiellae bacterium]|nr:hypothetical protein [Kiritimatiellia bacterium]